MKQLTNNPSYRSALMGWQLMLLLCQAATPSPYLFEFVRYFLQAAVKRKKEAKPSSFHAADRFAVEAGGFAYECLSALSGKMQDTGTKGSFTTSANTAGSAASGEINV